MQIAATGERALKAALLILAKLDYLQDGDKLAVADTDLRAAAHGTGTGHPRFRRPPHVARVWQVGPCVFLSPEGHLMKCRTPD